MDMTLTAKLRWTAAQLPHSPQSPVMEEAAARITELEAELRDLMEWDNFPPGFKRREQALALLSPVNAEVKRGAQNSEN